MLPGRLTLIAMKRPLSTVTGAALDGGCTGDSGHRVPSTWRRRITDRFTVTRTVGIDPQRTC